MQKHNDIKINAYNSSEETLLILAIKIKDMKLIEAILKYKDVDIHKHDKSHLGMTPLAHAVQQDNISLVKLLLQYGAKPYIANKGKNRSNTPFLMACWDNKKNAIAIMEELLRYKISINQVDGNGFSAIIKASIKGHCDIAKWLLDKGADANIRDFKGKSALDHAKENAHNDIINLLERQFNAR